MSAEDRFDGTPPFPVRQTALSEALQNLWSELEAGYILHKGQYECGLCKTKLANSPREVKHDEGCIQPLLDAISAASGGEVKEFAVAILHGDPIHRGWLTDAAESFVSGKDLPAPRSDTTDKDRIDWLGLDHEAGRALREHLPFLDSLRCAIDAKRSKGAKF